eukprot:gene30248-37782_t
MDPTSAGIDDLVEVVITEPVPEYAETRVRTSLEDSLVTSIVLEVDLVVKNGILPAVSRSVRIVGRCAVETLCQVSGSRQNGIFAVAAGGFLYLQTVALRFGYSEVGGGALHLAPTASAFLLDGVLEANEASSKGGAVYCSTGANFTAEGNQISGNVADQNGHVLLIRSSVVENRVSTGGAVANSGGWV